MDSDEGDWRPLFENIARLQRGWPVPAWTWDPRACMLACSFGNEHALAARASAAEALSFAWSAASLHTAPAGLRTICDSTGGLRAGQLLLAGKAGHVVFYGLWWPWGGGTMITLRLGIGECEVMEEPFPQVRELFGVRI